MKTTKNIGLFQSFQLRQRFFVLAGVVVFFFVLGFPLPGFDVLGLLLLIVVTAAALAEAIILYYSRLNLSASRKMAKMLSLGDENQVEVEIINHSAFFLRLTIYDELPHQFQMRNFRMKVDLKPDEEQYLKYTLRPLKRGEYHFGVINAITTTRIGLVARRVFIGEPQMTPVYPSIIQMKKYELLAFARISNYEGIKKVRKLGHSYEFEKIRQYATGDDLRSINWKATGRRSQLMVNQYEDERSQQVYSIIDKSRSMHMPFDGLSLLDYAVNTSLVISNIALQKYDKTGLITFSHKIGSTLPAERSPMQLKKILQALYYEKPQPFEANYDLLYRGVKNVIHGRSLIFFYLNFESSYAMERALPVLKKINHIHLLVIMIFENSELADFSMKRPEYVSDIYAQTIALKLLNEKKQIVAKLRKYGIQTILSKPQDLSINTVNKYLELKAKGMI